MGQISDFRDLIAWKDGHKLVLFIYDVTKKFPKEEIYGLTSQMRRAVVSVTSNIVEGFGRQGYKEKIHFYYVSQGSLIELKNQIEIAKDVGYLSTKDYDHALVLANQAHRLLQGLITRCKSFLNT